jgi:choline dehydrogenase-like flavoprotein
VASIHWRVSDQDLASITTLAHNFFSHWPGERTDLPVLHARVIGNDGSKPYDAYHPVATCRMGEDAEAVVDHALKVWGVENLWVVSTGVLPSAGTANPTFTMLCLAQGLVDHLSQLEQTHASTSAA